MFCFKLFPIPLNSLLPSTSIRVCSSAFKISLENSSLLIKFLCISLECSLNSKAK